MPGADRDGLTAGPADRLQAVGGAIVALDSGLGHMREMYVIRAEFGRQTFPTKSKWYKQFGNLWGCYTNLCIWVERCGDDDIALNNFNNSLAAIAL